MAPRCSRIIIEPRRSAEEHEESMNTHAAARAANARKRLAETSGSVSSEEAAPPCPTRVAVMTAAAMSGSSGLHALGSEGLGAFSRTLSDNADFKIAHMRALASTSQSLAEDSALEGTNTELAIK